MPPQALGLLIMGLSNSWSTSGPLPRIAGSGFLGDAVQYISYDAIPFLGIASNSGDLGCSLRYPSDPSYLGCVYYQQWAALTDSNNGPWAMSNYVRVIL